MRTAGITIGIAGAAVFAISLLYGQATVIPSWWFTAEPKAVFADPLFPTLPLTTRKEIISQIDPKFAKMKPADQDRVLWNAETDYLPRAATPRYVSKWVASDPSCTSELREVGWISPVITKRIKASDLSVQAALERFVFLRAHVRIENDTPEAILIKPQMFVLEPTKPRHNTLFFEYPSRVYYQFVGAALRYDPGYTPTERTTIRSGATGKTVATVDAPDPVAKQDMKDATSYAVSGTLTYAATIEQNSALAPWADTNG